MWFSDGSGANQTFVKTTKGHLETKSARFALPNYKKAKSGPFRKNKRISKFSPDYIIHTQSVFARVFLVEIQQRKL